MFARSNKMTVVKGSKRQKTMSEIINEQFDGGGGEGNEADAWDEVGGDGPQIEHYYEGSSSEDAEAGAVGQRSSSSGLKRRRTDPERSKHKEEKRLRRRGPLDPSLSAGDYAATPVDVEAAMEGIFGALEMGDDEDEEAFDEVGEKGFEKGSRVKRETEEEYIKRLEAQQSKKISKHRAAAATDEGDILHQLESLRSAQMSLIQQPESCEASDPQAKERQRAQEAIRHYVMVYSQLLRIRIKLQPLVARMVSFPQYYALDDFLEHGDSPIKETTTELATSLKNLLRVFHSLAADANLKEGKHRSTTRGSTPTFKEVNATHRRLMAGVDTCIDYWGTKFVQSNSAKLRTVSQPLLQQIHTILSNKALLRARVQKNRAHVAILGHPEHYSATCSAEHKAARALHIADGDMDEEIYDDGEFLREVVRRGGVIKLQQQLEDMQRELKTCEEPAKRGFHRLTKGKALNYEPRPKLVGFLLPVPFAVSGQHEILFNSLFQ